MPKSEHLALDSSRHSLEHLSFGAKLMKYSVLLAQRPVGYVKLPFDLLGCGASPGPPYCIGAYLPVAPSLSSHK